LIFNSLGKKRKRSREHSLEGRVQVESSRSASSFNWTRRTILNTEEDFTDIRGKRKLKEEKESKKGLQGRSRQSNIDRERILPTVKGLKNLEAKVLRGPPLNIDREAPELFETHPNPCSQGRALGKLSSSRFGERVRKK